MPSIKITCTECSFHTYLPWPGMLPVNSFYVNYKCRWCETSFIFNFQLEERYGQSLGITALEEYKKTFKVLSREEIDAKLDAEFNNLSLLKAKDNDLFVMICWCGVEYDLTEVLKQDKTINYILEPCLKCEQLIGMIPIGVNVDDIEQTNYFSRAKKN